MHFMLWVHMRFLQNMTHYMLYLSFQSLSQVTKKSLTKASELWKYENSYIDDLFTTWFYPIILSLIFSNSLKSMSLSDHYELFRNYTEAT